MTSAATRPADVLGAVTATRHRLALGGRRVEVWTRPVAAGASLSVAGVRLAEGLVARLLTVPRSRIRVAPLAPSGRPVALRDGACGACGVSISHLRRHVAGPGVVAAAACRGADVGVDIVAPADTGRAALARFLSPAEAALAADAHGAAAVWAAKEAAFKAAGLDEGFRPGRVAIDRLTSQGFAWCVRGGFRHVRGRGLFVPCRDHLLAIAVTHRAAGRPRQGESSSP